MMKLCRQGIFGRCRRCPTKICHFLTGGGHFNKPLKTKSMAEESFDVAHVSVFDPIHVSSPEQVDDKVLTERATASFRALFAQLRVLPRDPEGRLELPKPTIELPRENPIPAEKPKTRWQQFVENKRLKIQKKEKKVYDEQTGEWHLRYGYKKTTAVPDDWMIEVPNGVNEDPFAKKEAAKKEKVAEQKKRERRNKNRAERAKQEYIAAVSAKGSYRKDALKAAVKKASKPGSSASMNQFNDVPDKPAIFEDGSAVPKIFDRNKGRPKKGKK